MRKITTLLLFLLPTLSWADNLNSGNDAQNPANTTATTGTEEVMIDPNCLDSEDVCFNRAVAKEKLTTRCEENPDWCEQRRAVLKERREARQALKIQCDAKPEQCEQLTKEFKQQQKQKVESQQAQWCTDNPQRCEQWKADQKALREQCQVLRRQLDEKYQDRP